MSTIKLTCLYNADGQVIGYFSDHVAAQAARAEWDRWYIEKTKRMARCRSVETYIKPAELENVEPGDGDRVDYVYEFDGEAARQWAAKRVTDCIGEWLRHGASSVEVRRYLINRYRRPGMSNRDSDLGGPEEAAGILYVLRVKAP